ncbi:MAG TPA: hypothetical protein VFR70_01545 [Flavobacterium sp.]|nr:hypothetical protein [Flavobacterium sp.]
MKLLLPFLFFWAIAAPAQIKVELTAKGIIPNVISGKLAPMTDEAFIDTSQAWAQEFSKGEADALDITQNSLAIEAFRDNAFYYTNRGETFYHRIKYRMEIAKSGGTYTCSFKILEIYTKRTLLKSAVADYFLPDGKVKEDFEEVKPSLERSIGIILNSYDRYMKLPR